VTIGITKAETQIDNKSSTGAEGYFVRSDGSVAMDGILRMDDNKITELADPVDPQDAVNLRTLQTGIGGSSGWNFSVSQAVPASGTLYLSTGRVFTSSVPVIATESLTLSGVSIGVDKPDIVRGFSLDVLVNGVVVFALPLPAGTVKQSSQFLALVDSGDEIALRIVKTSGSGKSSFKNAVISLVLF